MKSSILNIKNCHFKNQQQTVLAFSPPLSCLQDQTCRYNASGMAAQCKGYKEIPVGNERALAVALYKVGPVSVGIDAQQSSFQFYKHGQ